MDVICLGGETLRIKGKNTAVVINPTASIGKTLADAVLLINNYSLNSDASKVEGVRIRVSGPGEYEIGGVKISVSNEDTGLVALLDVDNIKILVGNGKAIERSYEKTEGCDIAIIYAQDEFNYSILASLEPKVLLVLGDKKEFLVKSLGKDAQKSSKFSTSFEKLPEEMQVVILE